MKLLVVYGTNSGGTEEVCEMVRDLAEQAGHTVHLQRASATVPEDFLRFDAAILASCTWEHETAEGKLDGQLQEEWRGLQERLAKQSFPGMKIAVIGLGDSRYTKFAAAATHLETIVQNLQARQVGETLRVDGYYFHLPEHRKQVATWTSALLQELTPTTHG